MFPCRILDGLCVEYAIKLLTRFYNSLHAANPSLLSATSRKRYTIAPPQLFREGNKKSIFANVTEICKKMHRQVSSSCCCRPHLLRNAILTLIDFVYIARTRYPVPLRRNGYNWKCRRCWASRYQRSFPTETDRERFTTIPWYVYPLSSTN